jgi:hypothetical protein
MYRCFAPTLLVSLLTWVPIQAYDCALPPETFDFALVAEGDASIGAHSIYLGVAVGGKLSDGTPDESATFDRTKSYVGSLASNNRFNFNGGISANVPLSEVVDYEHYEWLAQHAKSSNINGKKVVVVDHGGKFNTYNFNNGGQGYDNGNTLVIFNTAEDVTLTKTSDGRQFGPSVLAPFSKVILKGNAGFIDGFVVAKEFTCSGGSQGSLQLHGATYKGELECIADTVTDTDTDTDTENDTENDADADAAEAQRLGASGTDANADDPFFCPEEDDEVPPPSRRLRASAKSRASITWKK